MDFFNYWGGLASFIGVVVSVVGLWWAIKEARGAQSEARKARSAAQSAEQVSEQVKLEAIENAERHLLLADIQRAVDLIQRLKLLHSIDRWEGALEQYQVLRELTSSIISRCPANNQTQRDRLVTARAVISGMEDSVSSRNNDKLAAEASSLLNLRLNGIQRDLEDMATATEFARQRGA